MAIRANLMKQILSYRKAFEKNATPDAHLQSEEFIREILKKEPERIQLYYCLGLIYYFYRHDLELAKEAFLDFKKKAGNTQYSKWVKYVDKYLIEMELTKEA